MLSACLDINIIQQCPFVLLLPSFCSSIPLSSHPSSSSTPTKYFRMPPLLPALLYPLLCAYAIWVLLIHSTQSGLFPAIEKAVDSGFMPDGTPLIQKYTGHEWTDGLLVTLVTFFFPLTWKSNDGAIEHVQNVFAGVAVALTAMLADAYRPKSNFLLWW